MFKLLCKYGVFFWILLLVCLNNCSLNVRAKEEMESETPEKMGYIYLSVDDSRDDVDLSTYIVMVEHNWPITLATVPSALDSKVTGISTYNKENSSSYESLGLSVEEVCHWVQEHGGEIAVHDLAYVWDKENTRKKILDIFPNAYEAYNKQTQKNVSQEQFINLAINELRKSKNYDLDNPDSARIHFEINKAILEMKGFEINGILASGGSFTIPGTSVGLDIKSWRTTQAGEWASKYYLYSDQYGISGSYYNPRYLMAYFVRGGSAEKPGTFDSKFFREKLDECYENESLFPLYWHTVNSSEVYSSRYNRMSIDMYREALDIIQEYVDAGKIKVVNPSWYYKNVYPTLE